jgi:hypothetical protein
MIMLLLSGCGAPKALPVEVTQKDSVIVVVKESVIMRDSIIYVEVPVEVMKEVVAETDTSHLETSLAVSEAWVSNGSLQHTLQHKEKKIEQEVSIPEKVEETEKVIYKEIEKVVPVEVEKELTKWQSFRMTFGDIAMICVAIIFFIVLFRLLLRRRSM